jgi:hydroxymethylbilane synthase
MTALRIATRASELALRRARHVQAMLVAQDIESELVTFRTHGDRHFEDTVASGSANRAFTRELELALTRNRADLAVHSYPDLETEPTPGLALAAVLARDDPRDVLVLNELIEATSLAELPRGTRLGTSSVRCRSLLRALYPAIEVVHLRGDLPSRLRKVDDGQVHATIVPAAALNRLDISQRIAAHLALPEWLPSPAQGTIIVQTREDDGTTRAVADALNDQRAALDTAAERAFLGSLEGGVQSPIGALVIDDRGGPRVLHGLIADLEGRHLLRAQLPMDDSEPALVGVRLANELRARGASRILDLLRSADRLPAPQPDS